MQPAHLPARGPLALDHGHGLVDDVAALLVLPRGHQLRQQLESGQLQHLAQGEMQRLAAAAAEVEIDDVVVDGPRDHEAQLIRHQLLAQRDVGDDLAGRIVGHRQVHPHQDAVLAVARADPADAGDGPAAGDEIEAVDAARDHQVRGALLRQVADAPLRLHRRRTHVAAVDQRHARVEQRRLHDVARTLRDEPPGALGAVLVAPGLVGNAADAEGQAAVDPAVKAIERLVEAGHDIGDRRPVQKRDILAGHRAAGDERAEGRDTCRPAKCAF